MAVPRPVSSARSTVKICKLAQAAVSSLYFGPLDSLAAQKEISSRGNTSVSVPLKPS
ncbi:hypothetical protein F4811DRAFT_544344 [Daldinia bambusicola]|nr:hypothetical protein F4811DRAFT_544344 [Daldinia bambusicola]